VAQELDELDHTDDAEDQRQPHVANRPGPQLIDQDEGQNGHADQEICTGGCRHKVKTSPPGRHRPVVIRGLSRGDMAFGGCLFAYSWVLIRLFTVASFNRPLSHLQPPTASSPTASFPHVDLFT